MNRRNSRLISDTVENRLPLSPQQVFAPIQRIGGKTGWYFGNRLWRLRGFADKLVGGLGMRIGRRDPTNLVVGDRVDFWLVENHEPNRFLRLKAEMKMPGTAWLEFEVTGSLNESTLRQTSIFEPNGFPGLVYWYSMLPAHLFIFRGMFRRICQAAMRSARS